MSEENRRKIVVTIKSIPTEDKGSLSFFEADKDIPFEIKRIYYITGVKKSVWRGGHAHKELKQFVFCPYGQILITLDNGTDKTEILLDRPNKGIIIDSCVWREMFWAKDDSVLCVAASEYYDESDYIRNYDQFKRYIEKDGENEG